MASFHKSLLLFFAFFFALLTFSHAYTFSVGGRDGWTLHPSESYNEYSGRLRFIVNDNLHFKYDAASDSVLEVSNGDYDNCNMSNPITNLTGGDSYFTLNRSGPFYFISGNKSHCDQGQKLEVVVISPKTHSAAAPAPPPAGTPVSSPPESGTSIPTSPATSPFSSPPEPGTSPAASPGGGISASPTGGPATSPGGGISASPTGNPSDMNSPPPMSAAVTLPLSSTLSVSLVVMIYALGRFY